MIFLFQGEKTFTNITVSDRNIPKFFIGNSVKYKMTCKFLGKGEFSEKFVYLFTLVVEGEIKGD